MPFVPDQEVADALAPLTALRAAAPKLAVGDVANRRLGVEAMMSMFNSGAMPEDVEKKDFHATTPDGHSMLLRWYYKTNPTSGKAPGPAILYMHGGGMILGRVDLYNIPVGRYVSESGTPFLSVEFRYAPEHPHPTLVEDSYCGLQWLRDHAVELHVDPTRIGIMGDSGGGGIAAGLGLYARDKGFSPSIAKQVLIYPMLDDRNTKPDPELVPFMSWDYDSNMTGWAAVLGNDPKTGVGGPDVSEYASPARVKDPKGLPATYIEVGELDIFRNEDVEYARRLGMAGVSCELHVHPGVPHAFEAFAPDSKVAARSRADRIRVLQSF